MNTLTSTWTPLLQVMCEFTSYVLSNSLHLLDKILKKYCPRKKNPYFQNQNENKWLLCKICKCFFLVKHRLLTVFLS